MAKMKDVLRRLKQYFTKEAQDRASGDSALNTKIENETARATGVESGLDTRVGDIETDYLKASDKAELNGAIQLRALTTETGNKIDLEIDSTNFKVVAKLYDKNNTLLSTSNEIDLPLESVVVSGSYDSINKKVVLTLENGSTIEFSVADLIYGLQSEITSSNPLSSDLVSDNDNAHKFVSANEKAQITTNKQDIANIKDGANLDSFADVERELSGKQPTIDSTHKLSANLIEENTDKQFASEDEKATWNGKQNAISDLEAIRSGASAGASAVQPGSLSLVATSGSYNDLSNKPTIPTVPTNVSAFNNDAGYLTQHQDISGKLDKSGGEMTGPISFKNGVALPSKTLNYICGIDAFNDGGEMGWQSKADFLSGYATQTWVQRQGYVTTDHTYNFSGTDFVSGNNNNGEHNANNITYNGHFYYNSNGPAGIGEEYTDGALYSQAYSSDWVAQIAQDYRNGNLFVRSKKEGVWQPWKRIARAEEIPNVSGKANKNEVIPYYAVTSFDCNDSTLTGSSIYRVNASPVHGANGNYSVILNFLDLGTPIQLQIPDADHKYIYKRTKSGSVWQDWFKLSAGYADSAGNADTVDNVHIEWSGQQGASSTEWLAGWTPDGTKIKAVKRADLSVNYANSAGSVMWSNVSGAPHLYLHTLRCYFNNSEDDENISGYFDIFVESTSGDSISTANNIPVGKHKAMGYLSENSSGWSGYIGAFSKDEYNQIRLDIFPNQDDMDGNCWVGYTRHLSINAEEITHIF